MEVLFRYATGLTGRHFDGARIGGSWDAHGRWSDRWTFTPMHEERGPDGCPQFTARVGFPDDQVGTRFEWGVVLDGPGGFDQWGIPDELSDHTRKEQARSFVLAAGSPRIPQVEEYYLTHSRRLGAQKHYRPGQRFPGLAFQVYAPQAKQVELVFVGPSGYLADDGTGADPQARPVPMWRRRDGVWVLDAELLPHLADFKRHEGRGYMYRITNREGRVVARTDLYSRGQAGAGGVDPGGRRWQGDAADLDSTVSASRVVDADSVEEAGGRRVPADQFWASEHGAERPIPERVEDLIIYELHVGALGAGSPGPGTFEDAIRFLDHLAELGVNAVELMPLAGTAAGRPFGHGSTHLFAPEAFAGGRDGLKRFVRRAHQLGIAVLVDLVLSRFAAKAERAQWAYDSDAPDRNLYYWYEGPPPAGKDPRHGFVENGSGGWAPRYWDEFVRKLLVSAAVALVDEFHVDGFRVDRAEAIHRDNRLVGDPSKPVPNANLFGAKLLRELTRTLRLIHPGVLLVAQDESGWPELTRPTAEGGLGFDAVWDAAFYHHLVGDSVSDPAYARLLVGAARGGDGPLPMGVFAKALAATRDRRVVYHESHEGAGSTGRVEGGRAQPSRRTLAAAVDGARLEGATRELAEARARVAFGLSALSAGTPMFLMGEEVGLEEPFRSQALLEHRRDLAGMRRREGSRLFRFYQDVIKLRRESRAFRTKNLEVVSTDDAARMIAFKRWDGVEEMLVVATFADRPVERIEVGDGKLAGRWREVFSSDSRLYGGRDRGNLGARIEAGDGRLVLTLPAHGLLVLRRES